MTINYNILFEPEHVLFVHYTNLAYIEIILVMFVNLVKQKCRTQKLFLLLTVEPSNLK